MQKASVWAEKVMIPTYEIGEAEKNPIFLEKRVYQGSCGKVYPYPTIEKISDEKKDKEYTAVWLENEYIKVMVLPELGGRIQRAYDKTNDYDFVYYNQVIKPALVGLTGPWISGGIEFNWPQHHRPTTFLPVDYEIQENEDGSVSVLCHDVDQMYGTKGLMRISVYPGKAYIEIRDSCITAHHFRRHFFGGQIQQFLLMTTHSPFSHQMFTLLWIMEREMFLVSQSRQVFIIRRITAKA